MNWWAITWFVGFVLMAVDMGVWRSRAEDLNAENLEQAERIDILERALSPKPRVEFGAHLDEPKADQITEEILFQECPRKVGKRTDRLRSVAPVIPFQRGERR